MNAPSRRKFSVRLDTETIRRIKIDHANSGRPIEAIVGDILRHHYAGEDKAPRRKSEPASAR